MKCKYCQSELVFRSPRKTVRAGVDVLRLQCPNCKELFLATDLPYSHPYQTHSKRNPMDVKSIKLQIRLSPREINDVGIGKAFLTISDNRIQLQYKH